MPKRTCYNIGSKQKDHESSILHIAMPSCVIAWKVPFCHQQQQQQLQHNDKISTENYM